MVEDGSGDDKYLSTSLQDDRQRLGGYASIDRDHSLRIGLIQHLPDLNDFRLNPERYQVQASAEDGKRRAAGVRIAEPKVTAIPAFFAKSHVNDPSLMPVGFDDGLLALLQHHVKAEQEMVHEFVRFPSVDNLYRQSGSFLRAH